MSRPLRLLALVVVLVAGVVAAWTLRHSFSPPEGRPSPAPRAVSAEAGDEVVARALEIARGDSLPRDAWVSEIPDLDLASLTGPARDTFLRIANGRRCDCGCGYTLAGCRRFDSTCDVSGPRARALYDSVRAGYRFSVEGFPVPPGAD
jgi:hypothetical protein